MVCRPGYRAVRDTRACAPRIHPSLRGAAGGMAAMGGGAPVGLAGPLGMPCGGNPSQMPPAFIAGMSSTVLVDATFGPRRHCTMRPVAERLDGNLSMFRLEISTE